MWHNKRNTTMTKMKYDCKVVYARNADVPQKALFECSQSYVLEGTWNNVVVNQYQKAG